MKRDFLKDLGIEDKEIISKILDENSADIGRAKGETDDLKAQIKSLETQLSKKTTDYETLQENTKDYSNLQEKINQLELDKAQLNTDKAQLQVELDSKVSQILKNHAIENGVRDAKAKNIKAVMALLDMEKITYNNDVLEGLTDQLTALQSGEDTSFLFGDSNPAPTGTTPNNPPAGTGGKSTGMSFADAVAQAFSSNK